MATGKVSSLAPDLIACKGEVTLAMPPTLTSTPTTSTPHGTKNTIALTMRLDPNRYRRLVAYAARLRRARLTRLSWSQPWMSISPRRRNDVLTY
jgi:hypothetical protein